MSQSDVLIVGSGAAGLTAALNLADRFRVTVFAQGALNEGSTAWAKGGIAAVLEAGDTFESHIGHDDRRRRAQRSRDRCIRGRARARCDRAR